MKRLRWQGSARIPHLEPMEAILANIQAFTGGPKAQVNATTLVDKVDEKKGVKLALEVVCFSKDRPYQLHQLLSSLEFISDGVEIHISIVYITLLYQSQYEKLAQMHPSVTFIEEEGFDRCLRQTISSVNGTHIMFLVDDLLFLEGVNTR
ncbi:hypothetical protein EON64_01840 [archaeon]|nr:MAG: hypothetical protein EON64_01840 [archaeon]